MGMTVLFKGNFHSLNGNFSSNPCRLTRSYALRFDILIFDILIFAVNLLENALCAMESNSERNVGSI